MSRLKERYEKVVKAKLQEKFGYNNPMKLPKLRKITLNMGIAKAGGDKGVLQTHFDELALIAGQRPMFAKAKQSISNFKLREGQPVGIKVTLRGARMWEFLDRFVNIVLPRVRDFRGVNTKCDGRGNYSLGLDDQQVFPELNLDKVKRQQGMHITFVTSATQDEECVELLRQLGMPYKDQPVETTF